MPKFSEKKYRSRVDCVDHFPDPTSEETIYSLVVRYHIISGNPDLGATLADLYDQNGVRVPSSPIPPRLAILFRRIQKGYAVPSLTDFVSKHTTLPYYVAFHSSLAVKSVLNLINNDSSAMHTAVAGIKYGEMFPKEMAFCEECLEADLRQYGFMSWKTFHQLPKVSVCAIHGARLITGCVNCGPTVPHKFVLASPGAHGCKCGNFDPSFRPQGLKPEAELWLAQQSRLLCQIGIHGQSAIFFKKLRAVVMHRGFKTSGGIDYLRFADAITNHYSEQSLAWLGCPNVFTGRGANWVRSSIALHRERKSTLRVLLILGYLFGSVETIDLSAPPPLKRKELNDDARWKKRLRDLYKKYKHTTQVARHLGITFRRVRDEARSQGIALIQKHPSEDSARHAAIVADIAVGMALKEVVKKHGTCYESLRAICDQEPGLKETNRNKRLLIKRDAYRKRLLFELKKDPTQLRSQLRQKCMVEYSYIRTRDGEWFESTVPEMVAREKRNAGSHKYLKNNWDSFDVTLSEKIRSIAESLKGESPPRRITKTRLLMLSNGAKAYYAEPLPHARAAINESVDDKKSFHKRRIIWALNEIAKTRTYFSWTELGIISGLTIKVVVCYREFVVPLAIEHGFYLGEGQHPNGRFQIVAA